MSALLSLVAAAACQASAPSAIDRKALVTRHNIELAEFSSRRPLQVGNGDFAYSFDITGLQTFTPFNTMSNWGWHSGPIPAGEDINNFKGQTWDTHGRPVRYPMPDPNHPALSQWMASNPHRINLGRIGLDVDKTDGTPLLPSDLKNVKQQLDLWAGVATSRFEIDGMPVMVKTASHPTQDAVAIQIFSPLIKAGRLRVYLSCPGDSPLYHASNVGDWNNPAHLKPAQDAGKNTASLAREIEGGGHTLNLKWQGSAKLESRSSQPRPFKIHSAFYGAGGKWADVLKLVEAKAGENGISLRAGTDMPDPAPGIGKSLKVLYSIGSVAQEVQSPEGSLIALSQNSEQKRFYLNPAESDGSLTFSCRFSPNAAEAPLPEEVFAASRSHWPSYWKSGAAIDLSGSTDLRWKELERRVVLSQYLMAVNEAGSLPPQESGLVNNTWYGRFHMEMIWWHGAHWALWNRWPQLNRYLDIYNKLLPDAKLLASSQGYKGARWPKCLGSTLKEWPDEIHSLLIWQQPHPIFFAELEYRANPSKEVLLKWHPLVEAAADMMASYAHFDAESDRYILGPPLVPVSENVNPRTNINPAFELSYWRFGLRTASQWLARMGRPQNPTWQKVEAKLAPLPQEDGVYVLNEGIKEMWTRFNFEHPALTGSYGLLPGDGVDKAVMKKTLDRVIETWKFDHVWGWDLPMLAMCATRLGQPERAIDLLLHPTQHFQFDEAGLATGGPYPYFPSNGGLLYAVAMMAAGWDGSGNTPAPGFPLKEWKVKAEGFAKAL